MEEKQENKVLMALEALKKASKDIENNPNSGADDASGDSPSMKALLELETGSEDLLSGDPNLSTLSHLLSHLKALASSLRSQSPSHGSGTGGGLLKLLLRRRFTGHGEISRVAGSIGSEIQSWIDREYADNLIAALRSQSDDEKIDLLSAMETRVSRGFDQGLQDVLLKSDVYAAVEAVLTDKAAAKPVQERAAALVLALVRFNKAVFVGPVLMGVAVGCIVSIASGSATTLRSLCGLITHIKSPLIDVLHSDGKIPKLISLLTSSDPEMRAAAFECCLDIGYFGRKEAIEAMMGDGLVKILMELQRSGEIASSVARFAIQMEVGEGLRQREKRALKLEVVRRVKEDAMSDAEGATVLTEVLWGSTP